MSQEQFDEYGFEVVDDVVIDHAESLSARIDANDPTVDEKEVRSMITHLQQLQNQGIDYPRIRVVLAKFIHTLEK